MLQKYHAIRDRHKKTVINQVSKIIGARIANPDYEDPQKLFSSISSLNNSTSSIASTKSVSPEIEFEVPNDFDMTINENEVLTEFNKRLQTNIEEVTDNVVSSSQIMFETQSSVHSHDTNIDVNVSNSSQSFDSYYESLLEDKLNEKDLERCDSFRVSSNDVHASPLKSEDNTNINKSYSKSETNKKILRPCKAPPPIPVKPTKHIGNSSYSKRDIKETLNKTTVLNKTLDSNSISQSSYMYRSLSKLNTTKDEDTNEINTEHTSTTDTSEIIQSKGWVKTVIGRFE